MPSVWSAVTPDNTALGLATLDASTSVIAFSVLPLPPLQSEPRDQDGGEQERDHGGGDGRALAEIAAAACALVAERRPQMRGGGGGAAREHPDGLEVGERGHPPKTRHQPDE